MNTSNRILTLLLLAGAAAAEPHAPAWEELAPAGTPPSARESTVLAYDGASNRLIVFGGSLSCSNWRNDLWVLENADGTGGAPAWVALAQAGAVPAPAVNTTRTSAYDAANHRLITFGGIDTATGYNADVHVLANADGVGGTPTWTKLAPAGTPPSPRQAARVDYDPGSNRLILFGGDFNGVPDTGVWVLTNANGLGGTPEWILLAAAGGPPVGRSGHVQDYDPARNTLIVSGGSRLVAGMTALVADTWILTEANGLGGTPTWHLVAATHPSGAYADAASVYDPATDRLTLFGGQDFVSIRPPWVLKNATRTDGSAAWELLGAAGTPPSERGVHTVAYAADSDRMILFGGMLADPFAGCGSPRANDVFVLTDVNPAPSGALACRANPRVLVPADGEMHDVVVTTNTCGLALAVRVRVLGKRRFQRHVEVVSVDEARGEIRLRLRAGKRHGHAYRIAVRATADDGTRSYCRVWVLAPPRHYR